MRFLRAGDPYGEAAIFLPAGGWTGAEGLAVAEALNQFSWFLLDLPGTGGSRPLLRTDAAALAQCLNAFCERNGIVHPHLAGHSLGGYVALAAAATGRMQLRSLLLIDAGVAPVSVPQEMGWLYYAVPIADGIDRLLGGRLIARNPGPKAPPEQVQDAKAIAEHLHVPLSDSLIRATLDLAAPQGESWDLDGRAWQRLGLTAVRTWGIRSLRRVPAPTRALVAMFPNGPSWAATRAQRALLALRTAGVDAVALATGHFVFWDDPALFSDAAVAFYSRLTREADR